MTTLREFRRTVRACVGKPLAYHLSDGYGAVLGGVLERVARGERVRDFEISDLMVRVSGGPTPRSTRAMAVFPIHGIATYDTQLFPYAFSSLKLARDVAAAAADPSIEVVLLVFDTPGGMVTGTPEAADAIYAARQKKPVVAIIHPLAASAGYWLASQASTIISVPSGDVGSIGVFMAHADCSKFNEMHGLKVTYVFAGEHKVDGNPNEPLSAGARDYYQSEVDTIYRSFLKAVARGRGVSVETVREHYGKGRCMMAPAALKAGLIDAIAPPDRAFAMAGNPAALRRAQVDALRQSSASTPPASSAALARRRRLDLIKAAL